jgi:hypothetical protein
MNADLDYLYAHHAVGLCPEERCVTARANLAATLTRLDAWFADHETITRGQFAGLVGDPDKAREYRLSPEAAAALQGRVASREGSGT